MAWTRASLRSTQVPGVCPRPAPRTPATVRGQDPSGGSWAVAHYIPGDRCHLPDRRPSHRRPRLVASTCCARRHVHLSVVAIGRRHATAHGPPPWAVCMRPRTWHAPPSSRLALSNSHHPLTGVVSPAGRAAGVTFTREKPYGRCPRQTGGLASGSWFTVGGTYRPSSDRPPTTRRAVEWL